MERNLLSVIIPVYNVENYLDKCLESVVNQTYKNLEIILVDDGSTDGSSKICDQWSHKDRRIHVYHISNHGVSHARNEGLKHIKGSFVSFIDSDDWIDNDMFENLLEHMIKYHSEIGVCGYKLEYGTHSKIKLKKMKECTLTREEAVKIIFSYKNDKVQKAFSWELWDKIFDYRIIQNLKFDESIYIGEDMLFCWQAFKHARQLSFVPIYAYHYTIRQQSAMHQAVSNKSVTVLKAVRMILQDTKDEIKNIQCVLQDHYLRIGVRHSRKIFKLHAYQFETEVHFYQKYLRKHLFYALRLPYISLKGKMGLVLFCLPYNICRIMFY